LPESQQLNALNAAIPVVARHDALGARKLLDRMYELIQQEKEEPNDAQGRERGRRAWSGAFSWATKHVVLALWAANIDVQDLPALAQRVEDQWNRPATLAMAAEFGPAAQRIALLQEAAGEAGQGPWMQSITRSRLAALMSELEPKSSRDMFALARTQMESGKEHDGRRHGVTDYAFYVSTLDPAEARVLLETEWTHAQQAMQVEAKQDQATRDFSPWNLSQIAIAMAAVDVERAVEMARSIPPPTGESRVHSGARALSEIAAYALLAEPERRMFSISSESGFDMEP
jgi:hypothetical protein